MLLLCQVTCFSWGRDLFGAGATHQAGCKEKSVLKYNILKHHVFYFFSYAISNCVAIDTDTSPW